MNFFRRTFRMLIGFSLVTGAVGYGLLQIPILQDLLFKQLLSTNISRQMAAADEPFDGLRVFMCGTASPLPTNSRAQACVAIVAGKRIYLVDAGMGSANVFRASRLPVQRLQAILLTHYHSDHISSLYDFNLNSWVAGRQQPLQIIGPTGIESVVHGLNGMYRLDRNYRVLHHGADLLDPALGIVQAVNASPGIILDEDNLKITAFPVNHEPVSPAFGYRFDYLGRSVVVSGDTVANLQLLEAAKDADILLHDALSLPLVQAMEKVMRETGNQRLEKVFKDIQDYHADTLSLPSLVQDAGVKQLALYHLVPPPDNFLTKAIFQRKLPENTVITEDGMWFELPAGEDTIHRR